MKATKQIDIYLTQKRNVRLIDVIQYDTGIQLVFTLKDFTIPSGVTATLYVQKPSGKFVYQESGITVSGNTVTVSLHNQAITEHGKVPYQVSLKSGSDVITTFTGEMIVEKSLKDAGATESKTVIAAYEAKTAEQIAQIEAAAQAEIEQIQNLHNTYATKNEAANAIKGYLSGAAVFADDVSPVEHSPVVKINCPDGVDPSTVTVRRCGKNLLENSAVTQTTNGITFTVKNDGSIVCSGTAEEFVFLTIRKWLPAGKYILSGCPAGGSQETYSNIFCEDAVKYIYKFDTGNGVEFEVTEASECELYLCRFCKGITVSNIVFKPMLRLASFTDAAFEPYNGAEYIPAADGTVPGITSLSPCMTILTDTDGAVVECEYNRDTNKVIDKLINAITFLGGKV